MANALNSAYKTADSLIVTATMDGTLDDALTAAGTELDNTTDKYMFCVFDLELGAINTSAVTSPGIEVYAIEVKDDGTTYPDADPEGNYVLTIPFNAGAVSEAKSVSAYGMMHLNPGKYKFFIKNTTGVTLATGGNSLKCRRFTPTSA